MDPNKTPDELFDEVRAANVRLDQLRGQMVLVGQWRAEALTMLRSRGISVADIADRLDVTPAAVYKAASTMPVGTQTNMPTACPSCALMREPMLVKVANGTRVDQVCTNPRCALQGQHVGLERERV